MGFIIALLSGILMSIQGVFNTQVMKQTSMWVAAGFVQLTAFLVCITAWLFTGKKGISGLMNVSPRYMLLGGVIGAFITYTVIKSIEIMGPAKAAMVIVISQIVAAYFIELIGAFGVQKAEFDVKKFVWATITAVGIFMFSK